jgi:hypothetical protein
MPDLLDIQPVAHENKQLYTPKQFLHSLKTFEDLSKTVFYIPFVYSLIKDRQRTTQTTDAFSHSLAQILGNHPLVITELATKVFEAMPPILLTPEQRAFERAVYISPKEVWDVLDNAVKLITAVDKVTQRFCVFRMYEEEVPCPLGNYKDKKIKIWYCHLYGNRETYSYVRGTDEKGGVQMQLRHSPPIREFVELGNKLLGLLERTRSEEEAYVSFSEEMLSRNVSLQALQKKDTLQEIVIPKPLEESQLTAKQKADCYEMIRMYYQMYPDVNG